MKEREYKTKGGQKQNDVLEEKKRKDKASWISNMREKREKNERIEI